MKNSVKIVFGLFLVALIALMGLFGWMSSMKLSNVNVFVFNTGGTIYSWGRKDTTDAYREALEELNALHNTINAYDATSELSQLNASAFKEPFHCSDALWNILLAARDAYNLTHGAFDPTIGPVMKLWGFHKKKETLPSDEEIEQALAIVGMDKIVFDDAARTVRFTVEGMSLDFGGIAKGYAVDLVEAILLKHGIKIYMINLGGNILVSEKAPWGRKHFHVAVRDPFDGTKNIRVLEINAMSVATSGNYERSRVIAGKRIGHIMNPKTGRPVEQFASVTAVTKRGVHSDIFSTAVFVGGEKLAEELRQTIPDTEFYIINIDPQNPQNTQKIQE